ncbi:MAG: D-aminoacylase [Gammaproteobacteria bacterium]|nr:D-aminoacylase [Gammaproteobacteria bacterium]
MPRPSSVWPWFVLVCAAALPVATAAATDATVPYDVLIAGGTVYDGGGGEPFVGDVAIQGDRIAYLGPHAPHGARERVDAHGRAVAPGFINMLAHPEESLLVDGRALSDLRQGVTLEVIGEDSMGPLTPQMKERALRRQRDLHYAIDWTTLGEYLQRLEQRGIAPNVASFVGAGTVRINVLGERDVQPTPAQLEQMRRLVHEAMEQGAMGVTTALIYSPNQYARTPELIALATESARCGGIYSAHMRSEGDRLLEAVQETVDIARASGAPAEIYHLKVAGRRNWDKIDALIAAIDQARAAGTRITADMYVYTAGATGLDAAMPPWVLDGGLEAWIERLRDPGQRARVIADMRDPKPNWENLFAAAGPGGTLLLGFKNPQLKPLTGKTLAEVARMRGVPPEDAVVDLVIEDGSRVEVAYFLMSEDNVRREVALPWVSFDSDEQAPAPEGVFLKANSHPRAYGNFARVLAKYVREDKVLTLPQAIHKLAALPAATLSLADRGQLKSGYFADVVLFDPATVQDHATYERPHQLATGVDDVWVNGVRALRHGEATGAASGRAVRGRSWTGAGGKGCRASAAEWTWGP